MKVPPSLVAIQKKRQELKKEISQVGKDAIKELVTSLFEENPKLQAFKWVQGTPGFNDGDPCTFSVHGIYDVRAVKAEKTVPDEKEERDSSDDEEDDEDEDDEDDESWGDLSDLPKKTQDALAKLDKIFEDSEDVLLDTFGDGSEIICDRDDKQVFQVEEYYIE